MSTIKFTDPRIRRTAAFGFLQNGRPRSNGPRPLPSRVQVELVPDVAPCCTGIDSAIADGLTLLTADAAQDIGGAQSVSVFNGTVSLSFDWNATPCQVKSGQITGTF